MKPRLGRSPGVSAVVAALGVIVVILAAGLAYVVLNPAQTTGPGTASTVTRTTTVTVGGGGAGASTVTSTVVSTVTGSGSGDLVSLAKAEGGSLTVYSIIAPDTYNAVIAPNFTKAYPWAKINYVSLDPAGTIARPTSELKAGKVQADVVEAGNYVRMLQDINNGVCAPVNMTSYLTLQGYPPSGFDPAGRWWAWAVSPYVLIYNTNVISPSQAPKQYTDLANPAYKGKIAVDRPQGLGGTALVLAALYGNLGNASWTQFMNGFLANQPALQASGGTVETLVSQGQYGIGIDTLNGAITSQQKGLPIAVAWTPVAEGATSAGCITTGAPHPHMALLYAEWEESVNAQLGLTKGGLPSAIPAVTSYGLNGIVPSGVSFANDALKTNFFTNTSIWANIFTKYFGQ